MKNPMLCDVRPQQLESRPLVHESTGTVQLHSLVDREYRVINLVCKKERRAHREWGEGHGGADRAADD